MNRSFPGQPDGTVTQKIADFFQRELLPRADIVLDFHSGGRPLDFLPFCAGHTLKDAAREQAIFESVTAFGAPWSMKMTEIDATGMFETSAEEMGKIFVTTELGGGGTSTAASVRIARRGVSNVLKHAGILTGNVEASSTQWLDMPDGCFSFAQEDGMLETMVDLGEPVQAGADPHEIEAGMSGLLLARHFPGLAKAGDCVAVVAVQCDQPH